MVYIQSLFKKRFLKVILAVNLLIFLIYPQNQISAQVFYEINPNFNPNYLIADEDIEDYNSMTVEQIKQFTDKKGGTLDTYIDPELSLPAYYVIWQAAQEFQINPKFLLTLLQKEQSLVTDEEPTQNQYNWATGYSCYGGICLDIYKGFSRQVRAAAKKFRNYIDDLNTIDKYLDSQFCTFTKWCIGLPKTTQDQVKVTPQNKATAALYTYNPYQGNTIVDGLRVGANYNFWKIWRNWFDFSISRPNGSLLQGISDDTIYLIRDGMKMPFASFSALASRYNPKNIISVDNKELLSYPDGPMIKFPQYSLLMNKKKEVFLLVDDEIRKIASQEVFRTLGFNPEETIDVTDADLASLKQGEDITLESSYPTGALIMDKISHGVFFVQNGIKYPIVAPQILKINFPNQKILKGAGSELDKYPKGDLVKFKDGTLIKAKGDDKVYVIADGQKFHLKDESAFISRGYKWENIIETTSEAVEIHSFGGTLQTLVTSTPIIINNLLNIIPTSTASSTNY
jgi:hypothetical protein